MPALSVTPRWILIWELSRFNLSLLERSLLHNSTPVNNQWQDFNFFFPVNVESNPIEIFNISIQIVPEDVNQVTEIPECFTKIPENSTQVPSKFDKVPIECNQVTKIAGQVTETPEFDSVNTTFSYNAAIRYFTQNIFVQVML